MPGLPRGHGGAFPDVHCLHQLQRWHVLGVGGLGMHRLLPGDLLRRDPVRILRRLPGWLGWPRVRPHELHGLPERHRRRSGITVLRRLPWWPLLQRAFLQELHRSARGVLLDQHDGL